MVGAVLTQNAAWSNVEKAIERLKAFGLMSLPALLDTTHEQLAESIRPSGYYNIKARRLRNLCLFLHQAGGLEAFSAWSLGDQRSSLLDVNGVGPETADDILLYAMDQPVFVIDTYTRRLLQRYRLARGDRVIDQLVLGEGNLLRRQFDAQIAARDHDAIGQLQNFGAVLQRLGFFNFRDDHRRMRRCACIAKPEPGLPP